MTTKTAQPIYLLRHTECFAAHGMQVLPNTGFPHLSQILWHNLMWHILVSLPSHVRKLNSFASSLKYKYVTARAVSISGCRSGKPSEVMTLYFVLCQYKIFLLNHRCSFLLVPHLPAMSMKWELSSLQKQENITSLWYLRNLTCFHGQLPTLNTRWGTKI